MTHFQSFHVTQSTHVFFPADRPPNTCHTPPPVTPRAAGSKKTELPPDRIVGDENYENELLPPRINFLANSAKLRRQLRKRSSAAKERIVVRDSKGFPKELLPPRIQLFGDQNELLPPMINYRISFDQNEILPPRMDRIAGDRNELA